MNFEHRTPNDAIAALDSDDLIAACPLDRAVPVLCDYLQTDRSDSLECINRFYVFRNGVGSMMSDRLEISQAETL